MPRVRVIDPFGMGYTIESSNPELIADWLLEMCRKMVSLNAQMAWRIDPVYPLYVWDEAQQKDVPDWPVAGHDSTWMINYRDQMERLAAAIKDVKEHRTVGFTRSGRLLTETETERMSEARWCDYRDHPYKGGREGTIMMGQTVRMPNGGLQQTGQDVREICPECAAEIGLNPDYLAPEPPAVRREALTKGVKK